MDATILKPEQVCADLCLCVSALEVLFDLDWKQGMHFFDFRFLYRRLELWGYINKCAGGIGRVKDLSTYFEHNNVHDGHDCYRYVGKY